MDSSSASTSSGTSEATGDPTGSDFTFLYSSPDVGQTVEVQPEAEQEPSRAGRKRARNPDDWTKKHVKRAGLRKNAPYIDISSLSGCCKKECIMKFSQPHLSKIRRDFESLKYEQQNIYLCGLLHRHETKKTSGHKRKSNPSVSSKGKRLGRPPAEESKFSFDYCLINEKGITVKVCQKAFCGVHAFGPKRLRILRDKIASAGEGGIIWDKRGKHDNHQRVSDEVRNLIREHIRSFPARSSHYSRSDNPDRVYLSPELSIARLYRDFLEKHDQDYVMKEAENRERIINHQPVEKLPKPLATEHFYHDIFVTEFNIYFGYPRSDTCDTCDSLLTKIEDAQAKGEETEGLQQELEAHTTFAQKGYQTFHHDQKICEESWKKNTLKTMQQ